MEEQRAFKGIWIPAEIWLNEELSLIEKVLFAEIDSLDGEDGCYASNEYFEDFFKVSESTITRSIATLKRLGYIESTMIGGRTRILSVVKMTTHPSQNDYTGSSKNSVSSINIKNKNNIDNKGTGAGASLKNHSNIYKQKQTLSDDLSSGKDIAEQTKKKSPKETFTDDCLALIDELSYPSHIKDMLIQYFQFVSAVPDDKSNLCKRVKTVKMWKKKLDTLEELVNDGYDLLGLITQSLDRKQYVFYPLQSSSKTTKYELGSDLMLSDTEWAKQAIKNAEDNDEEFF